MLFLQVLFSQSFVYYNKRATERKTPCNCVNYDVFNTGGKKNEYDYGVG